MPLRGVRRIEARDAEAAVPHPTAGAPVESAGPAEAPAALAAAATAASFSLPAVALSGGPLDVALSEGALDPDQLPPRNNNNAATRDSPARSPAQRQRQTQAGAEAEAVQCKLSPTQTELEKLAQLLFWIVMQASITGAEKERDQERERE